MTSAKNKVINIFIVWVTIVLPFMLFVTGLLPAILFYPYFIIVTAISVTSTYKTAFGQIKEVGAI